MTEPRWSAAMISPAGALDGAPVLRREVTLDTGHGDLLSARLHVSSLGIFEATIDGQRVSDDVLSPGWSSYEWRLRYRTYDVTHLLGATSVLGIELGNGWYRGRLGWEGRPRVLRRPARRHRPIGDHLRRRPPSDRRDP